MTSKVCVVGGSGLLGAPVVRALLKEGREVSVVVRDGARARALFGADVDIVEGDVRSAGTLRRGLAGCGAVHISLQGGPTAADFHAIEAGGAAAVVEAARAAGLGTITLISGLSVALLDGRLPLPRSIPAPILAKREAERAVRESGLAYTIFRPSNVIEGLERSVTGSVAMAPKLPGFRTHWLSAEELGSHVATALAAPAQTRAVRAVLGPEAFTIAEALAIYAGIVHPRAHVVPLPLWILSVIALLSRNPGLRIGLEMLRLAAYLNESDPTLLGESPLRLREGVADRALAVRSAAGAAAPAMAVRT